MSSGIFWFQTRPADQYQWKISKRFNLNPCMMMSSNGDIFRITGLLCAEFTGLRPVTRSFDIFLDLCLNKRLSKQLWGSWFKTPSCALWTQLFADIHVQWRLFMQSLFDISFCYLTTATMGWRFKSSILDKMATALADDILKCIFFNENNRMPIRVQFTINQYWFS